VSLAAAGYVMHGAGVLGLGATADVAIGVGTGTAVFATLGGSIMIAKGGHPELAFVQKKEKVPYSKQCNASEFHLAKYDKYLDDFSVENIMEIKKYKESDGIKEPFVEKFIKHKVIGLIEDLEAIIPEEDCQLCIDRLSAGRRNGISYVFDYVKKLKGDNEKVLNKIRWFNSFSIQYDAKNYLVKDSYGKPFFGKIIRFVEPYTLPIDKDLYQISEGSSKDDFGNFLDDSFEDVEEDLLNAILYDDSYDGSYDGSYQPSYKSSDNVLNNVLNNVSDNVLDNVLDNVSDNVSDNVFNNASENTSENAVDELLGKITKKQIKIISADSVPRSVGEPIHSGAELFRALLELNKQDANGNSRLATDGVNLYTAIVGSIVNSTLLTD
ncbi:MAG: hypothetical protein ACRCZQ_06910, partial [Bacteroidales bacterium]